MPCVPGPAALVVIGVGGPMVVEGTVILGLAGAVAVGGAAAFGTEVLGRWRSRRTLRICQSGTGEQNQKTKKPNVHRNSPSRKYSRVANLAVIPRVSNSGRYAPIRSML